MRATTNMNHHKEKEFTRGRRNPGLSVSSKRTEVAKGKTKQIATYINGEKREREQERRT